MKVYQWLGNVRELRNAVERAVVLSRREVVEPEDLPDSLFRDRLEGILPGAAASGASLDEVERMYIERVLAESATLDEAAAKLGINVTTLWRKRKRYRIE